MKQIALTFLLSLLTLSRCFSQSDTTEYLFKNARFSYLVFNVGYSPMFFPNTQVGHATSLTLLGGVFNDRVALSLDFEIWSKNIPYSVTQYPFITSLATTSLNVETLIRSKKVINFSFPFRLGYGGAQILEMNPLYYTTSVTRRFGYIQPGAMIWVNLLKPVSLGAGCNYRVPFNRDIQTFETLSGFSGVVMLRFKFYWKEYMEKALARQREYMQQQAPK